MSSHVESEPKAFDHQQEYASNDVEDGLKHRKVPQTVDIQAPERIYMTDEQSRIVCRKIDRIILPILIWVYFLQILDKTVVGTAAGFGLAAQAGLVGNQYSVIATCGSYAQLAWQPFSAMLIVKVPSRILMTVLVFCWGVSTVGLAFSKSFIPLVINRVLLGLFEAGCLPLFAVITSTWYRRSEQPLRVALWYGTNGIATIFASFVAWALTFQPASSPLYLYQSLFLMVGLMTVITAPFIYWKLDSNPAEARFLTAEERTWAVERLRDNQTGIENKNIKWGQVLEGFLSPATWMYVAMAFCVNVGAAVANAFGPLIIKGFGFSSRETLLLNMPFGFLQSCVIVFSAWMAVRYKNKGIVIFGLMIPCLIGAGLLYGLGRTKNLYPALLVAYYLIASLYGANPLLVSWMGSNTGGYTKKALSISFYQVGSSAGNIVGPFLFVSTQAPEYKPGLRAVMGIFAASIGAVIISVALFWVMNKHKEKQRVKVGKPAKFVDLSMNRKYEGRTEDENAEVQLGENGFADMTDWENDEFVYTY